MTRLKCTGGIIVRDLLPVIVLMYFQTTGVMSESFSIFEPTTNTVPVFKATKSPNVLACSRVCTQTAQCLQETYNARTKDCYLTGTEDLVHFSGVDVDGSDPDWEQYRISHTFPHVCVDNFQPFGSSCYAYIEKSEYWLESNLNCSLLKQGAHLATIHSQEENDFLVALKTQRLAQLYADPMDRYDLASWIGASGDDWGNYTWVTGEPVGPFNILTDFPSGTQGCYEIMSEDMPSSAGNWLVTNCAAAETFFCEYEVY